MDAKIKRKWVKALRSGKYKQAEGTLRDEAGAMCCLGVLADIQGVNWDEIKEMVSEDLPRGLNAGLTKRQRAILASKNDGCFCHPWGRQVAHESFEQIADYIEKRL